MDFFSKEEISELVTWAYKPYDPKDSRHKSVAKSLKDGAWEKTRYWADKVNERLEGFEIGFKKSWSQRGRESGSTISVFKPYTWARIYRQGNKDKDIYFTVGVDANSSSLLYKLDYERSQKAKLTWNGKNICEQLIKGDPSSEISIPESALGEYSWEKVIRETVIFINNKAGLYDHLIKIAWSENENRISRLTWNTNGWVFPSGPEGKSKNEDSHEAKYGYGHEEWLFDRSKIIDGYHYGFLEPIRKEQGAYTGKKYNVWLYTIESNSKKRYWIGILNNIEVITDEIANQVKRIYLDKGWHSEMENQIRDSGGSPEGFSNYNGVNLFNIRYRPEDIDLNDPYFELEKSHPIYSVSRYVFMNFENEYYIPKYEESPFTFVTSGEIEAEEVDGVETKTYEMERKSVEITLLHRSISKAMVPILKKKYGEKNVTPEHPAGYGANRVDIVVRDGDGKLIFYEIKTYNSVVMSIRQSIGQLMEYAYWPDKNKAKELVIVTPKTSDTENVRLYLENLRENFLVPIYHQSFDLISRTLSERI